VLVLSFFLAFSMLVNLYLLSRVID
jgi:hypothetical protein